MAILKYISVTIALVALTSCYRPFEPELDTKPVLCINSLITAGQPIKVSVTHTWKYNAPAANVSHAVDDAIVEIIANGKLAGEDYLPAEGDHIKIRATSTKYGEAEGEVTVPVRPTFTTPEPDIHLISGKYIETVDDDDYVTLTFNMLLRPELADNPDTDNYYIVSFNNIKPTVDTIGGIYGDGYYGPDYTTLYFSQGTLDYKSEPLFSEHENVFESAVAGGGDFTFFSDRQINSKKYPLTLRFLDCQFRAIVRLIEPSWYGCLVNINIASVSESYYKWLMYTWNSEWGALGEFADFGMGDPLGGYSNVSSGAGVIAAQSFRICKIPLGSFLRQNTERAIENKVNAPILE